MNISVDIVRRLAKLDPGVREVFYSFVDEFEKDQKQFLTKQDLNEIVKKIELLFQENASNKDLTPILEKYKTIEAKLDENNKKFDELTSQLSSISDKLESILDINKEMVELLKSKQDSDFSDVKDLISENTKGVNNIIEDFKNKLETLAHTINSSANNKILSNLSKVLKKRIGLNVKSHFRSKGFQINGKNICFPIFGKGTKNKKTHTIVGEIIKSPTIKDIDKFDEQIDSLVKEKQIPQMVCKVIIVEQIEDEVEKQAEKKGISIIWLQDL